MVSRNLVQRKFDFVEIARRVPWGFYEFEHRRTNLALNNFLDLAPDHRFEQHVVVLHILVGEGTTVATFRKALMKACESFAYVVVMDHNAKSRDWQSGETTMDDEQTAVKDCLSYEDMATELKACSAKRVTSSCFMAGVESKDRNMVFLLEPSV
eukprot:TRINITY_DN25934_c0_g1_i1.p3 TRINITY_DN25934_c0_g1~~TRINITY_DN25934_c0_g1_i1.p3  ORF type:complete len:154 (+),score=27.49 TRINITY_DN25934_c0_g1_i1:1157-1618(+)